MYDTCLKKAILLGLINQQVCEKCIEVGDQVTSADLIWIAAEVYNSDRQLSIMQSMSATATAATAVQNPSICELHMVPVKHNRKVPSVEDRNWGMHNSCYCHGATPSHLKKEYPIRDAEC